MAPISNATRLADFGSGIGTQGAVIKIDHENARVGIGTTIPAALFQVGTGITMDGKGMEVVGVITAKQFIGAGINTAATTTLKHLTVSGVSTFSGNVLVGASATVGFGSTVFFKDGNKLYFGNSEDLSIYHDGSNSYIKDTGTGGIYIDASGLTLRDDNDENYAVFTSDGSSSLYYDNSKKVETIGYGLTVSGIVSATSYYGDGSNLEGVSASGLGTALSDDDTSILQHIFKASDTLNVAAGTSVRVDSDATSGNIAFMREGRTIVASGATFTIGAGTTLVSDVLGIFKSVG